MSLTQMEIPRELSQFPDTETFNLPQSDTPAYLLETEAMEMEDIPLQVALLTMEIAGQRQFIAALQARLTALEKSLPASQMVERISMEILGITDLGCL